MSRSARTKAGQKEAASVAGDADGAVLPAALTLLRGLEFDGKKYAKGELIEPAAVGLTKRHVDWLIDSKSAEVESEGGEA